VAGADRYADRRLSLLDAVRQQPWAFDFYQVLRRIEALHPDTPRLGEARRPADEPVRLGQAADLDFAPSNVTALNYTATGVPRIVVRFLGLWGPQGPMPLHLTEFARERQHSYGDPTLVRFADVFHHRLLLGFFRAWRQAQPAASRDRPQEDRFRTYVGATFGQGLPTFGNRDAVPDDSKRHFAGALSRVVRTPDGLAGILSVYFGVPATVDSFAPRWMTLPVDQRSRLGSMAGSAALGQGAVVGSRVRDAQSHVALHLGPMSLAGYEQLLPSGGWHARLRDWVLQYVGEEYGVHATLTLRRSEVPAARLGRSGRLGWTTWAGRPRGDGDVQGVRLALTRAAQ